MFGFSMIKMVRQHARKIDRPLRNHLLDVYQPYRIIPCFLHNALEGFGKHTKKVDVIIAFHNSDCHVDGVGAVEDAIDHHFFCQLKSDFISTSSCCATMTPVCLEYLLNHCEHIRKVHLDRTMINPL